MFVAYLDHAPPGIRIQDQNCWDLGVETETSNEMVSGICGGAQGNRFTGSRKVKYKWVSRVTLPCLPVRVSRPTGAVRISPYGTVWWLTQVTSYVNE